MSATRVSAPLVWHLILDAESRLTMSTGRSGKCKGAIGGSREKTTLWLTWLPV